MVPTATTTPPTAGMRVLAQLLQDRGLSPGSYALFFTVGEGTYFQVPGSPEPIEESSGFVIDTAGAIHAFWLEWDSERQRPILSDWEPAEPEPSWEGDAEYEDTRRQVGLAT